MKKQLLLLLVVLSSFALNAQESPASYGTSPEWNNILTFGGNGLETVIEMQKDADGNLYVLGNFYGETTIDTEVLNSEGVNSNIYLAKFSTNGDLLWITQSDAEVDGNVNAYQLGVYDEKVYILGHFKDGDKLSYQVLNGSGIENCFFAEYDSSGNLNQVTTFENNNDSIVGNVSVSSDSYVTPRFTLDKVNGFIYLSTYKRLFSLEINSFSLKQEKIFDDNLTVTDLVYYNNKIYITGYIGDSLYLDSNYINFTGSYQSLFYAALNLDFTVNIVHNMNYENNGQSSPGTSNGGKFLVKNNELFLAAMNSIGGILNNITFDIGDSLPFIITINDQDDSITNLRKFNQDDFFLASFYKLKFLFSEQEELYMFLFTRDFNSMNKLVFNSDETETLVTVNTNSNDSNTVFGLQDEMIKAYSNQDTGNLNIIKFVEENEVWIKEFIGENGNSSSTVIDVISDKTNYYYALVVDDRKSNNLFGSSDINLVKLDFDNTILWSIPIEGDFNVSRGIGEFISYANGSVVIAGNIFGEVKIGDETIVPTNETVATLMIAKFSENGDLVNHKLINPTTGEDPPSFTDILLMDNGEVIVSSILSGRKIGELTLLNNDLTIQKTVFFEDDTILYTQQITKGQDGKVHLVGEFFGETVTYGDGLVFEKPNGDAEKNGNNVFFELDSELNVLGVFNYAHSAINNGGSWPCALVGDNDGNKYVSGFAYSTQDFTFNNITPIFDTKATYWNHYYAKINEQNEFDWVQIIGSDERFFNYSSIDIDALGNLYISGFFQGKLYINDTIELDVAYEDGDNAYILKYNNLGEVQWIKTVASPNSTSTSGIAAKNNGDLALGGYFSNQGVFDENTEIMSQGGVKSYLATLLSGEVLSLNEEALNKEMTIFPNPSKDIFNVNTSSLLFAKDKIYTQVLDLNGRIIFSKEMTLNDDSLQINLSEFSKGVYLVKLKDGINTYSNKIILE